MHLAALKTLKARHHVGRNRRVGVADMRCAIGIEDRGRDIEALFFGHVFVSALKR